MHLHISDVNEVSLTTKIARKHCFSSRSYETVIARSDVQLSTNMELFSGKKLKGQQKEFHGITKNKDDVFLQFICSTKKNVGEEELFVDVLTYPNITKTRWDGLGHVILKVTGSQAGHIEIFDSFGMNIYQVDSLEQLSADDMKHVKGSCLRKAFQVELKIVYRYEQKVGKVLLLGDVNGSYIAERGVIDNYQGKILFPWEENCLHTENHKALLLAVPGIC